MVNCNVILVIRVWGLGDLHLALDTLPIYVKKTETPKNHLPNNPTYYHQNLIQK